MNSVWMEFNYYTTLTLSKTKLNKTTIINKN